MDEHVVEFGGHLIDMVDSLSDVAGVSDLGLGVDSILFELAITTARATTSWTGGILAGICGGASPGLAPIPFT
jgi:hypothetical protein